MGLGQSDHFDLRKTSSKEAAGTGWLETLRQWLVQCPQCFEVRLVVSAQEDDRYICKDCGHSFSIGRPIAPQRNRPRGSQRST